MDYSIANDRNFTIIDSGKSSDEVQLKCFRSELKSVDFMTPSELFCGFDTIRAITFSYDISFMESILQYFNYAEVVFGGDHMTKKDRKLNAFLRDVFTNAQEVPRLVASHPVFADMLKDGNVNLRVAKFVLDHRKIYLLSSDDGLRTRVITTSANMSHTAWNGDQMEFYSYDDTRECYDEYNKDFDTAWDRSVEVPYQMVVADKSDDWVEGNPIIKKVKETDSVVVLEQATSDIPIENISYIIDRENIYEECGEIIDGLNLRSKKGFIEIVPKTVDRIIVNAKKFKQKYRVENITENYPQMTVNYDEKEILLNGNKIDLNPSYDEVDSDVNQLIELFQNFNGFVGDSKKLQESHFRLLNAMFASLFTAKVRCMSYLKERDSDMPLYLLAASSTANCGKTFMISAVLKMMTGKNIQPFSKTSFNKAMYTAVQVGCKGVPVFVDEMDGYSFKYLKEIIKDVSRCEVNQIETMPMLVFASNNILNPDETLRKRMVFLKFDGSLPSSVDQTAYKNKGKAIIRNLGTGLFREYSRRTLDVVCNALDYLYDTKIEDIPSDYYFDLMQASSQVLVDIFNEHCDKIPSFVKVVTWEDDYSPSAKHILDDAVEFIEDMWNNNKKAFTINDKFVCIEVANTPNNKKDYESIANSLPREMQPRLEVLRDVINLTFDRVEYEKRVGYRLSKIPFLRRKI